MKGKARLLTPRRSGAIAVLEVRGAVADCLCHLTGAPAPVPGGIARRSFAGIDVGLVARWGDDVAWLMPHGGSRIVARLLAHLEEIGFESVASPIPPLDAYPEAVDAVEALMLEAAYRLTSPLGLALLLDQPQRWRTWDPARFPLGEVERRSRPLQHLLTPPVVAVIGPVNAGKSTLTNALAGREASIAASAPGTTRDYVGALVDLGGLIVRWIDTPGQRRSADPIEAEAQGLAAGLVAQADLVVEAREALPQGPQEGPARLPDTDSLAENGERLLLETKGDLLPAGAPLPPTGVVRCSARTGEGLVDLAAAVRARLVAQAALDWPGPWLFDPRLIAAAGARA